MSSRKTSITGSGMNGDVQERKAFLVLEDGTKFEGVGFGASKSIGGEVGEFIGK